MNDIIFNLEKIDNVLTMSSLEMVKLINSTRKEGDAELLHKNFMAKVPTVLGEEMSAKFLAYKETPMPNGGFRESKVYQLPKREACLMAMSYSD